METYCEKPVKFPDLIVLTPLFINLYNLPNSIKSV